MHLKKKYAFEKKNIWPVSAANLKPWSNIIRDKMSFNSHSRDLLQMKYKLHHLSPAGLWFNITIPSYRYREFHCGKMTGLRPSYLHNGISHTGQPLMHHIASLVWSFSLLLDCISGGCKQMSKHDHPVALQPWPSLLTKYILNYINLKYICISLTHLPLVPHICVSESGQHWFSQWLVAYSAPNHDLNQCLVISNWTLRNKFQCNFDTKLFIQENAFEKVVCQNGGHFFQGGDEMALKFTSKDDRIT